MLKFSFDCICETQMCFVCVLTLKKLSIKIELIVQNLKYLKNLSFTIVKINSLFFFAISICFKHFDRLKKFF